MIKLLVLGLLMEGKDRHPYEMLQLIKERKYGLFVKVSKGSLYYNIEQLRREACIVVSAVDQEDNRPERSVYSITERGKEKFEELLRLQLGKVDDINLSMYSGMLFAGHLEPVAFRQSIELQRKEAEFKYGVVQEIERKKAGLPWSVRLLLRNIGMHHEANLRWCESVLAELDADPAVHLHADRRIGE